MVRAPVVSKSKLERSTYLNLSPPRGIQSDLKLKQNCDRANNSRMVYVRGRAVDKINKTTQ